MSRRSHWHCRFKRHRAGRPSITEESMMPVWRPARDGWCGTTVCRTQRPRPMVSNRHRTTDSRDVVLKINSAVQRTYLSLDVSATDEWSIASAIYDDALLGPRAAAHRQQTTAMASARYMSTCRGRWPRSHQWWPLHPRVCRRTARELGVRGRARARSLARFRIGRRDAQYDVTDGRNGT